MPRPVLAPPPYQKTDLLRLILQAHCPLTMGFRDLANQVLYASPLLSGSRASVSAKRQEESETKSFVDVETNGEMTLFSGSDVDVRELRNPDEAKRIWDDSDAGTLADGYIDEHGVEYGVQNFDLDVLPAMAGCRIRGTVVSGRAGASSSRSAVRPGASISRTPDNPYKSKRIPS